MCTPQCIFKKLGGPEAIESKVCEARDRGEEIKVDVLHWQTDVDKLKNDVDQLVGQSTARENMCCITCSCPNIMTRYKLSKQAEENIVDANNHIKKSHFEEISRPRPRPPELESLSDNNYVNFDSRASIFKDLIDALKYPNVNMIGVYGLGGVGKTTLVKEVGNQMRQDGTFKQVAFAVVSKDLNVKEVQSKLAGSLNLKLTATTNDQERRRMELWNKFTNGDKYLVILDDIWEMVDLKIIGIPILDGKTGCKVVLTSRKEDLLRITMKVDRKFSIAELPEEEAWDLFKKKVGNSIESRPKIYLLACELCRQCKGLPLAINALGTALQDKPDYTWKNASDKLKKYLLTQIEGIDRGVIATLRVSYDMLRSSDAQSCFLLCCLFAEDAEISIDELTRHCMARRLLAQNPHTLDEARNAVFTVVDALKSASLLTTGAHENVVKIHDVIRDVGISISRDEKAFLIDHGALRWPENPINGPSYSTISLNFKNIKELPDGLVYPQLYTLMVGSSELSDLEVPDNFFNGMTQLTVLSVTKMCMRRLPSSLAKLKNLRMLNLNGCELEDIAILKDMKSNLEVLSLRGSSIKVLPPEIAQLTSLRLLDLSRCSSLIEIPPGIISNLTNLEELLFPDNFDQWEAIIDKKKEGTNNSSKNVGLEELRQSLDNGQLTTLHIFIPNVKLLPKDGLKFENLKRFRISVGSNFDLYENFKWYKKIPGTRVLKHEGSSLRNEFIPLVYKAEALSLIGIKGLKEVLDYRGVGNGFPDLRHLEVESCDDDLEYFLGEPKSSMQSHRLHPLRSFNKLNRLVIEKCKLRYLFTPTAARGLVHLEQLTVRSCEIMEAIVGFEGHNDENELIGDVMFSKLKELVLEELPNLISFYAENEKTQTTTGSSSGHPQPLFSNKVILPVLEELKVEALDSIEELWDKQSPLVNQETVSFGQLRNMTVKRCKKLMNLVPLNILPRLWNLQFLEVNDCPNVEFIVFKNKKGEEEEAVDDSTLIIPQLRWLEIWNMEKLKRFYSSSTTSNAQSFFNHQVIVPVLERLYFWGVGNIIEIWDEQSIGLFEAQGSFCQLMNLDVHECNKLMHLFPPQMHLLLKNLKELHVERCETMEGVVEFEGEVDEDGLRNEQVCFSKLTSLRLKNLPKLVSFCTKMGEAGTTEGNPTIHAQPLFNGKVAFPAVEDLTISEVPMIKEIWVQQPLSKLEKEVESFYKLKSIMVWSCDQLEYVLPSYMLPQLHNLLELKITGCKELEVIVSNKLKEIEATNNDIPVFPQLKTLTLRELNNLKCFCTGTQLLFSHKVAFPALEHLEIDRLPHIIEIWDKKPVPEPEKEIESFCKLAAIFIWQCDQLVYILPSYMLPRLQNLRRLKIGNCKEVEVIVSKELMKEKEAADNDTIVFPQLKDVVFSDLPTLKSFYTGTHLFSNKVTFPRLENLELDRCESLRCVFQLSMARVLVNLQQLIIHDCSKIEAVVDGEEEIEDGQGRKSTDKTLFPHLSKLELRRLPELRRFCQFRYPLEMPLLSQMVIEVCPRLNSFSSGSVSSSAQAQMVLFHDKVAFPRLGILELDGCKSLRCIFQPSMARVLVNLEELIINDCSKMVAVVDREEEIEGKRRKTTDKTLFPHLNKLELRHLPELRWFCHFRYPLELPLLSQMVIEVCPGLNSFSSASVSSFAHAQMVLFNDEVQFPRLENLELEGLQNVESIWGREYPTSSLSKLNFLKAKRCVKLKNIFRPSMAEVFVNLQELIINDCSKMKAIVDGEEEVEDGQRRKTGETLFPHFSKLELRHLPELRRVCHFAHPLKLPLLSQMVIEVCPSLNSFSSGSVSTPNLFARDVSYDFVGDDTTVTED
ncbi:hypothetical protein Vadar_025311 [Vaccinium darrowii]|uniref:Uncharacterized protein n=1 Tax=Vaccinium darrowii TaxID=229202 RepID=A0ACB7YRN8_9ERIC|nr:hypothetical protein Vadar_025311 [Vaccinium darrowii]